MDDFCMYNLFRKPRPRLFIPPPYARTSESRGEHKQTPMLHLRATDPSKILLLCESLKDECTIDLEAKINCYLMDETECDSCFMAFYDCLPKVAVIKVIGVHALEPEIQLDINEPSIAQIGEAKSGIDFTIQNLPPPLLQQLQALQLNLEKAVITVYPIYDQKHRNGIAEDTPNVNLVVFIVNSPKQKMVLKDIVFECYRFVLPVLRNTIALERQTKIKSKMNSLLEFGELLYTTLDDKAALLNVVTERAKFYFDSESCDVYLIDEKRKNLDGNIMCNGQAVKNSVPKTQGILGMSFTQNKLLNIKNAHDNPLFIKSDDEKCGFYTRNILCIPIPQQSNKDQKDHALGCIQLKNKISGEYNVFDENMSTYFASYVGIALSQCEVITKMKNEGARHDLSNKLLLFEFEFREAEVEHLLQAQRHDLEGFDLPTFNAREVPQHRVGVCLLKMFEDLEFIPQYKLDKRALAKFLVLVGKGYFDHPYHNYEHAFSAAHFVYSTICYLKLLENKILSGLDAIALLISAISHNIDHHGFTNPFRTVEESTFGSLYSSARSIQETHHFAQTMTILNSQGCNFLVNLPKHDYAYVIELIRSSIIATDYAEHLKHAKKQELLLSKGFRPRLMEHKRLFCALLMTCGDFADHLRDWRTVRTVVSLMYEEYFRQGDLEREMGKVPNEMMDREKARIPLLQIEFLKDFVLPPFDLLVKMYPEMQFTLDAIYDTITNWDLAKPYFEHRNPEQVTSTELLLGHQLSLANFENVEEEYEVAEVEESLTDFEYDD